MARRLEREKIKRVIDALREKSMQWNELKQLTYQENDINKTIPDKTLERILKDYLSFWGLVEKVKDEEGIWRWSWFEHIRTYHSKSKHVYELSLYHSKKLVPAMKILLSTKGGLWGLSEENKKYVKFCRFVEEHLKTGYSPTYGKLTKYRDLIHMLDEKEKAFEKRLKKRILMELEDGNIRLHLSTRFRVPNDSIASNVARILAQEILGLIVGETGSSLSLLIDRLISHMPILVECMSDFDRASSQVFITKFLEDSKKEIEELRKGWGKTLDIYRELAGELELLRMRINMRQPLQGKCRICPQVSIKE